MAILTANEKTDASPLAAQRDSEGTADKDLSGPNILLIKSREESLGTAEKIAGQAFITLTSNTMINLPRVTIPQFCSYESAVDSGFPPKPSFHKSMFVSDRSIVQYEKSARSLEIGQTYRVKTDKAERIVSQMVVADSTAGTVMTVQNDMVSFVFYYVSDDVPTEFCLTAEEYPLLAQIWDNDDDAIFDTM